jgi:hypothetical protein
MIAEQISISNEGVPTISIGGIHIRRGYMTQAYGCSFHPNYNIGLSLSNDVLSFIPR